ncbi:RNA degradosome polyphosphate kinase [candidate division KSB1 bacterium]|nr:RNA degradosome polyphosphate kinase [candidate division KSB1 bacterium]
MNKRDYIKPEYFISRELSFLEFNYRVLEEAIDSTNPLLERLKFISIFSSNLDEFFMVRVGGLKQQVEAGYKKPDPAGLSPKDQIINIASKAHELINKQYNCLKRSILPQLRKQGIEILSFKALNEEQQDYFEDYFHNNIISVLTPMAYDPGHPFPVVINLTLNFAVELRKKREKQHYFAIVQVPTVFPRYLAVPSATGNHFILIEELIEAYLPTIFIGYEIVDTMLFRITRNADFDLDEEGAEDLLAEIAKKLKTRKTGKIVRLEVAGTPGTKLFKKVLSEFNVKTFEVYDRLHPLDLTFFMKFSNIKSYDHLRNKEFPPHPSPQFNENIFEDIKKKDIFLHVPYESFDPIINLIETAADDPDVLAIKQVLYRVSGNSPVVNALARAAENGKQVSVLVELKARFDEESNIGWAKTLEKAGCHVVYGIVGLKTHCKALLIIRHEDGGVQRYVHLGTGNYNDKTARLYTDCGVFTAKQDFGADVSDLFNLITGYSEPARWRKLAVAPLTLRRRFINLIENEVEQSSAGTLGLIIAKMNSLVDSEIIRYLYWASCNHVEIKLIVRGICCLRPGIPGISENISVSSIVDRFLEHSRIYYFNNGGQPLYFLSSADWMPRNLDRRIETMFPVSDPVSQRRIKEILDFNLRDNVKTRILQPDGSYARTDKRGKTPFRAQVELYKAATPAKEARSPVFTPAFEVSTSED